MSPLNRIIFFVDGEPKGQPRPKAFSRGGIASVYDPGTAENWKSQIAAAAKTAGLAGMMLEGPIQFLGKCFFARPKSHYRSGKMAHLLRPDAPFYHIKKPDFDNLGKAVCDCLTHIGAWKDDSQVADGRIVKMYSDAHAYCAFHITRL